LEREAVVHGFLDVVSVVFVVVPVSPTWVNGRDRIHPLREEIQIFCGSDPRTSLTCAAASSSTDRLRQDLTVGAGVERTVCGLDGCRSGWVVVSLVLCEGRAAPVVQVVPDLREVVEGIETGWVAAAAIDIPIGLPAREPRQADLEARRRLGPRASSVFPAPVRASLGAETYEQACARSREVCGKAISRQLFNILPKIRQVDALQSPRMQDQLFEMHPEVSFAELAGPPMRFHKSTAGGRAERLRALQTVFPTIEELSRHKMPGAQPDDVLDAFVGAWTARRYALGAHIQLGGDYDERGLRMEVIV
jgi:predicted RNase H-like nuclease